MREAGCNWGQQLGADEVAGECGVEIGLVLDPLELVPGRISLDLGTARRQQGPQQRLPRTQGPAFTHAGKTVQAGAAQHLVQYRFRLVVLMLRREYEGSPALHQRGVTR